MDKPKKFIHVEKTVYRSAYSDPRTVRSYHFGRIEISGMAVGAIVFVSVMTLIALQIILGIVSDWTVIWPIQTVLSIGALWLVYLLVAGFTSFIRWVASEITVHGPGRD